MNIIETDAGYRLEHRGQEVELARAHHVLESFACKALDQLIEERDEVLRASQNSARALALSKQLHRAQAERDLLQTELEAANLRAAEMAERLALAEGEALEQARLLGIGGSREAALLAKIEQLEKSLLRAQSPVGILKDAPFEVVVPLLAPTVEQVDRLDVEGIAHRACSRYLPGETPKFQFERDALKDFALKVLSAAWAKGLR